MRRDMSNKTQVPITWPNIVHRLMFWIVYKIIHSRRCSNVGVFKVGDVVEYNWKAKYQLSSLYDDEKAKGPRVIRTINRYSDGTEGCDFEPVGDNDYHGCDVFWIKKATIAP